jgi:hypothetical protein
MPEFQIQRLEKVCPGFQYDVKAGNTDVSGAVLDIRGHIRRFDKDGSKAPVI